jgi:hypothetical protein
MEHALDRGAAATIVPVFAPPSTYAAAANSGLHRSGMYLIGGGPHGRWNTIPHGPAFRSAVLVAPQRSG